MKHYHILNNKGKTADLLLRKPIGKSFRVCNNPFSWTDSRGHWRGDSYNPNRLCMSASRCDLDKHLLLYSLFRPVLVVVKKLAKYNFLKMKK